MPATVMRMPNLPPYSSEGKIKPSTAAESITPAANERTISENEIANGIENLPSAIEITSLWGNTYQNPNNLNEIVSLGDLYVNEEGNAILDEDGNEQYKLELTSNDGNNNSNKTISISLK